MSKRLKEIHEWKCKTHNNPTYRTMPQFKEAHDIVIELLTMIEGIDTEVKYLLDNWAQDDIPSWAVNEFLDTVKSLLEKES